MRAIAVGMGCALDAVLATPVLRARAAGMPVDQQRLAAFARLADVLADPAPAPLPDLPADAGPTTWPR